MRFRNRLFEIKPFPNNFMNYTVVKKKNGSWQNSKLRKERHVKVNMNLKRRTRNSIQGIGHIPFFLFFPENTIKLFGGQ